MISPNEYAPYYAPYVEPLIANEHSLVLNLHLAQEDFLNTLKTIDEAKHTYRYAEGKWSIKELVQHLIDTERVFAYRAMCFARKDSTPLPGFDENVYVEHSRGNDRPWKSLVTEMEVIRKATLLLFESFSEEELTQIGKASGYDMSVRAIGYCIAGHQRHHLKIIRERYL